jgi:hypothetical protein
MKKQMKNWWYALPLLVLTVFVVGCTEDDDDTVQQHIDITFLHPTSGEVIPLADAQNVEIHVQFKSEGNIDEVEIEMYDINNNTVKLISFEEHVHTTGTVDKTFELDLSSYAAGTRFRVEAEAKADHDSEDYDEAVMEFSLGN